ncbi:hypothetical protein ACIBM4_02000 [Streptomyces sp. NPDC050256]|uniref:hypothetical protein n=1 Tax=Streptomyces sp. NPDC050256 TaxID=3365607 RepID=UPI003787D683
MKYKNETEIMRELGIDSWRHLSKDKMIRFAAMMPNMDTEVALKIVEQFPAFKEFAKDAVDTMEKAYEATLSVNKQSQEHVHQAFREIRQILREELNKENLSQEERRYIIQGIQETGRMHLQTDATNKQFLDGLFKKVVIGVGSALALGVVFVGGKMMAQSNEDPDDSLES